MKRLKTLCGALVAGSLLLANAGASVLWESDFTDTNVFPMGKTIDQRNGWAKVTVDGADTDLAIFDYSTTPGVEQPLLRIYSTSTQPAKRTSARATFTRTTDPSIQVTAKMGWEWSGASGQASVLALGPQDYNVPLTIVFKANTGIQLVGKTTETLLAIGDVKQGYLYEFVTTLHYETQTFDFLLKGIDASGTSVNIERTGLEFAVGVSTADRTGLNRLYLANGGGNITTMYVEGISIIPAPIPEAGAMASVLLGAGVLSAVGLRKWRKP